ncbi:MAG: glycosyltransferase [Chloroflexi bacterium]|nr:glycosyltransferase [Chloroflexota bacterium]
MMRLAVVTPLDAAHTGVADYSRDLLPYLAEAADHAIDVFTDRGGVDQSGTGWRATPIGDLAAQARRFDLIVYQMGNSPAHDFMADCLFQFPGLIVLHDLSLHYFFARQSDRRYLRAFGYGYGTDGTALGRRFKREFMSINYPEYLVSEGLIDRNPGAIVHSHHAFDLLSTRCPTARLDYVPMPIPLPPERSHVAARARLNLKTDEFLIGVFGVLNDSKQPRAILAAMRQLLAAGVPIKAVFIGRENDTFHLADEAPRLGLSDHINALGFVDDLLLVNEWLVACDIAINLRSPYWGETSASTLRLLAAGTPVIVNNIGSFAELPDAACLKLPPIGPNSPEELTLALRQLYDQPDQRAAMQLAARQYVAIEHNPRRVAARYLEVATSILEAA